MTQPAQAGGADLGFDLFDDAPKKSAAQIQLDLKAAQEVERKGRLRRQLLTAHQAFGFSTLAVFAAALVIGVGVSWWLGSRNKQSAENTQKAACAAPSDMRWMPAESANTMSSGANITTHLSGLP